VWPVRTLRGVPLRRLSAVLLIAAALAGAAGCGSGDDQGTAPAPSPPARAEDFPTAKDKATLGQLIKGVRQGPQLAPSVSALYVGRNRFGFALFDQAGKQINGAAVAIYTASGDQTDVRGPYPARSESMAVKPAFASKTASQDPDTAKSVYVSEVPFASKGKRVVIALAKLDGRLVASSAIALQVATGGGPPRPGEKAIKIDTPTTAEVGDVSKIDTRVPPDTMHDVNFANVLDKKPVVLVFATPALCKSRVCGPVVDAAEQLKSQYGDKAAFIHMEIYNDNDLSKGYRPQVRAWRLPSEPWTFMIDRQGRVVESFEGAASVAELQRGIEKAISA
jgi:hypothetical protein